MLNPVRLNLQLFAEETIPDKTEGADIDNKPDDSKKEGKPANKNPFERLYKMDFTKKKPEKKEETKELDVKESSEDKKPDETVVDNQQKDKPEQEPEYDEIVYNKEKVKIPVTERQAYLQKGYNYDKVKQIADKANAALAKAAKLEGFDKVDDYLAEIEKREKLKIAEQIEEAEGDPEKIDSIIKNHPEVIKTREERRRLEFEKVKDELRKDRFFKEIEPQFDELMAKNPTAAPDLVYKILRSDYLTPERLKDLISKEKESVEKKVIADIHDKERRAAPTGGDVGGDKDVVQPTELSKTLANIFGVSASKVAQRAHERLKRS
jgi:hypothetical protein